MGRIARGYRYAAAAFVLAFGSAARATPDASVYIEQTFLGANAENWFYLETIRRQPGSYYEHTEVLRLCARRKSDAALVDSVLVSEVRYARDPATLRDLPSESRDLPPFDLTEYVRRHAIHLAGASGLGQPAVLDSTGVYFAGDAKRVYFIRSTAMRRPLPEWGRGGEAGIRSIHRVWAPWSRDAAGEFLEEEWYFVVDVGTPGSDSNSGRFVLYATRQVPAPRR